jgi:C-terminal processing protease CtpA/Prc
LKSSKNDHDYEKLDDKTYKFTQKMDFIGSSTYVGNICILTSNITLSAADILVSIVKDFDNVTIIGTSTGGEVLASSTNSVTLPESGLIFNYVPSVHDIYGIDTNSLYGTEVDIYVNETSESFYNKLSLIELGIDPYGFIYRIQWDNVLNTAIGLIEKE